MIPLNEIPAIPTVQFDALDNLVIVPSATSSKNDFNFYEGRWKLQNKKLRTRLNNCTEWLTFESTQEMYRVLNGLGNIDNFKAEIDGNPFEGMTLRLFDPAARLWNIYWADSNIGKLDTPVTGSFENKLGHFFAKDKFNDIDIVVVFQWDARIENKPVWRQAFSADRGKTWEWNWFMFMEKIN